MGPNDDGYQEPDYSPALALRLVQAQVSQGTLAMTLSWAV
jgi:hypothetical protein